MTTPSLSIIILAAGKGTRMKSNTAKVLHEVFFAPMVQHVTNAVLPLAPAQLLIVVGHQSQAVEKALRTVPCEFVIQEQQRGTGDAVLSAEKALQEHSHTIMILCGDTPLIRTTTLAQMYESHQRSRATLTLMTTILDNPTNYGRIITNTNDEILGIVEQKDASPQQLSIKEINAGIYCIDKTFLFSALKKVDTNNSQQEFYLTDIVKQAVDQGMKVDKYIAPAPAEVLGVNSRIDLADAQIELQLRRNRQLMLQGITIYNPETVAVAPDVNIAHDSVLEAGVRISGKSSIGQGCKIGQGAILDNCQVGELVHIGPYCCLNNVTISSGKTIPPLTTIC